MRSIVAFLIALAALMAGPAQAQVLSETSWIEEWIPAEQRWVRVEGDGADRLAHPMAAPRASLAATRPVLAQYGPFRVTDHGAAGPVAELTDVTDRASPTDFATMMADFPGIATLSLVEAPGTADDRANLRLGRMIRAAGIATHVPRGGSVRSGAVELFLAGAERRIDDGAEFAVHSWIDPQGREPSDFAMEAAPNAMYLDYYREMGMTRSEAVAFYGMTNSVSFAEAKWLSAGEMRGWIGQESSTMEGGAAAPKIAYADIPAY